VYLGGGFKRDIFIDSLHLILPLTLIMTLLYEFHELLIVRYYFLSFDHLLKVVFNTSIKHKFSFKLLYKDKKRARYKCNYKDLRGIVSVLLFYVWTASALFYSMQRALRLGIIAARRCK